jgi:hypothetical protein
MKKIIIVGLSLLLIFSSCRSKKNRSKPIGKNPIDTTKPLLEEIKNILNNTFDYNYLSYKAKCDYKDQNMDQSFTMNIRMKKDSILWLSITAVGFEVARAILDADSVKIISRLDKKYFTYGYDYIKKLSGTSLSLLQIQNLLTANLLFPPEEYAEGAEKTTFKTTQGYIENSLTINDKSKILEQILQHLIEQSNAKVIYSEYKKTDKQTFPGQVDISVITPKRNISLIMENSGINTNDIESFPFEISSKYEKGN